jgi:glutathione S-transferase
MMKLYYKQGACSLSPHIALREAGLPVELVSVDLRTKTLQAGADFNAINAKSQVPVLELDDGQRLTEGPAIVQYIADLRPQAGLAPPAGSLERVRLQEWLNFTTSELHKTFAPLFNPATPAEWKQTLVGNLGRRFDWLSHQLEGKSYLLGEKFSVADGYLFTVLSWAAHVGIDLAKWPVLKQYCDRVASRPKVREAMQAEGLLQ